MSIHVTLYRGYANEQEIVISGHVVKSKDPAAYKLDQKKIKHALTIIRLFRIQTLPNVRVRLRFKEIDVETKTMNDGYFKFCIPYREALASGWHQVTISAYFNEYEIERQGEFIKPHTGEYGLISDIDDTFLISHSGSFFKKIYVLLTRNIERRKTFDGVVEHYRLLASAGRIQKNESNAFFYVSSSEWNLYGFIEGFAERQGFPKAVIQLKKIKQGLADFLFTGGGSHDHKFHKIKSILEFYPELRFVLLGDDSQKDPYIYERIVKMFPMNVRAIYIRQTMSKKKSAVVNLLKNVENMGVAVCYFEQSAQAKEHSLAIGLVKSSS